MPFPGFVDLKKFWPILSESIDTDLFRECLEQALALYGIHYEVPFEYGQYLEARLNNHYCQTEMYEHVIEALRDGRKSYSWYENGDACVESAVCVISPLLSMAFNIPISNVYIVEFDEGDHYAAGLTPTGPFFDFHYTYSVERVPTGNFWLRDEFLSTRNLAFCDDESLCKPSDYTIQSCILQEMKTYGEACSISLIRVGDFLRSR